MTVPQMAAAQEFITLREAAQILRVSRTTIYLWAQSGRLPGLIRLSDGTHRVHRPTFERHLLEQARGSGPQVEP